MCCDFFLKYFTEYEVIDDDDYDDINYFDEAINILSKNERGLVIHRTSCGMITFSERFPRWYGSLSDPLFTFINELEIVQATCEIKQLFFMGKLPKEKHHRFYVLIKDYYSK